MATKRGGQVLLFGMLLSALLVVWAITATLAHANGIVPAHQASVVDVGPCESGSHWVLTDAAGVTAATLTVDGVEYPISARSGPVIHFEAGPTTDQTVAFVTYEGSVGEHTKLNLSHCEEGSPSPTPTPTPTPSPSPSGSPTPTPTPPPTSTPSSPPSSGTHTPSPRSHTPTSSVPTPSVPRTAFTGSSALLLGALALLLLATGLVALRVGSTRRTARR